ncbi:MAG: hypothetical protein QGD94_07145 [Planctomycetia bacterium]|nr:hypothetical protein [Planctomycetia bacterium]
MSRRILIKHLPSLACLLVMVVFAGCMLEYPPNRAKVIIRDKETGRELSGCILTWGYSGTKIKTDTVLPAHGTSYDAYGYSTIKAYMRRIDSGCEVRQPAVWKLFIPIWNPLSFRTLSAITHYHLRGFSIDKDGYLSDNFFVENYGNSKKPIIVEMVRETPGTLVSDLKVTASASSTLLDRDFWESEPLWWELLQIRKDQLERVLAATQVGDRHDVTIGAARDILKAIKKTLAEGRRNSKSKGN